MRDYAGKKKLSASKDEQSFLEIIGQDRLVHQPTTMRVNTSHSYLTVMLLIRIIIFIRRQHGTAAVIMQ